MTDQRTPDALISTKQHRRFAEFLDACRESRYIGLCYGPPGVGKTFSARYYSKWHLIERYYDSLFTKKPTKSEVRDCKTIFYTAHVGGTARTVEKGLAYHSLQLYETVKDALPARQASFLLEEEVPELLIVDEADRLKLDALEQVRDFHDQSGVAVVFIGMPGLEKRLARYAQLYSRVGFVHEFESLSADEVHFILERRWNELGLPFNSEDFADHEALTSIVRITHGNFRLIQRLLSQAQRIMKVNKLKLMTKEVVETARDKLVIGLT